MVWAILIYIYVPSSDTFIEKDASVNEHIEQMRLSATKAMLERRDVVVVASVSAIYCLGDPDLYLKMMIHLTDGMMPPKRCWSGVMWLWWRLFPRFIAWAILIYISR